MRILAFSDLHRDLEQAARLVEMSAEADLVLAAGDFASTHRGLEPTIDALAAIVTPTLLVPGNNETDEALRHACAAWEAATVLHGDLTDFGGVAFYGLGAGIPTTPWEWSFDLTEEEAAERLAGCPCARRRSRGRHVRAGESEGRAPRRPGSRPAARPPPPR